jgi:hypothetical protein
MEWVAIDVHIGGDAVTHRLAAAFRLRVPEAAGLLALVFGGMAQHAQDGSLADVTDSQIESWALWHGKRGTFAAFFRAQLCDEDGTVRAWEKYNGAAIREAKASRERMRQWREKRKLERGVLDQPSDQNGTGDGTPNGTANGTRNEPRSVRPQPDLTRPDRTRPNRTTKNENPSPRAAGRGDRKGEATWITPFADAWKARFGGDMPIGPALTALAPLRTAHGDEETLRRWMNYMAVASPEFVNPARFASTWARWDTSDPPSSPSTGGASPLRPTPPTVEAGNIVAEIRELIFDQPIPGQANRRLLRNADVERLGEAVARAYRTVGGNKRFLAADDKPDDLPHLIRAFADALQAARRELEAAAPVLRTA